MRPFEESNRFVFFFFFSCMCLQSAPMSLLAVLQLHACAYVEEVMKGGSGARREYRAGQPEKSLACAPGRRGSYFEKQRNRKTKTGRP